MTDGTIEPRENSFRENGTALIFPIGPDFHWRYELSGFLTNDEQYQPLVEARSQIAGTEFAPRPSRRRVLDEVYEEEIEAGTFSLGLPHWYSVNGSS